MSHLHIADPCHESWDGMTPNQAGRHCAACDKTVVDVTAMEPQAARTYLERELPVRVAQGERVCVRAHADRRGRLLRGGVRRRLLTNGLAAVLAMAGAEFLAPSLSAAEDGGAAGGEAEPLRGEVAPAIPPAMGMIAMPVMGDVACEPVPDVTPLVLAAPALTCTANAFTVTATRADGTVAWETSISTLGVPVDEAHYIRQLVTDGKRLIVCYGGDPAGEPLQLSLDPATGAALAK